MKGLIHPIYTTTSLRFIYGVFISTVTITICHDETFYHFFTCSIEEENRISSCPATLETKNLDVRESIRKFVAVLNKLETHVSLIAAQSKLIFMKLYFLFQFSKKSNYIKNYINYILIVFNQDVSNKY